jgi:hypothetical protein
VPAKSKKQQQFFGIVRSMQKGEMKPSGEAGEAAKNMKVKDVEDFAKTKHKGLPNKVKKEAAKKVFKRYMSYLVTLHESLDLDPSMVHTHLVDRLSNRQLFGAINEIDPGSFITMESDRDQMITYLFSLMDSDE